MPLRKTCGHEEVSAAIATGLGVCMGYVDPTKEVFAQFRADDRQGPIHMLNLVRLRPQAAYPDGRKATGAQAYAAYGRDSGPVFERLGGRSVWQGRFELMLIGPA